MRRTAATTRRGRLSSIVLMAVGAALLVPVTAHSSTDPVRQLERDAADASGGPGLRPLQPARPGPAAEMRAEAVTASGTLYDAVGDNEGLAPDLVQMVAFTSDDGRYSVGIILTDNALITGDFIATYVNTDGSAATGNQTFGGADLLVSVLGQAGTDIIGSSVWNGVGWQSTDLTTLIGLPSGTTDIIWSVAAAEIGVGPGQPTSMQFGTLYSGIYDTYFDFAPEPGGAPLAYTAGALSVGAPAPAPPAPAPAAPVAAPAPSTPVGIAGVPPDGTNANPVAVRSLGVTRTSRGLRLRVSWTKGDGEIYWSARLSTRVNGRVRAKEVFGVGATGNRTVLRSVNLPESWRGRRVSVRVQVDDDNRTVVRTRSVVFL